MSRQRNTWVVVGLLALCVVPLLGGLVRLADTLGAGAATPDNARFLAAPIPVVLHVVTSLVFGILGAFQFSASLRQRRPNFHRRSGRIVFASGLIAALSGLWMTLTYPWAVNDGMALFVVRLIVGAAMAMCLCMGVAAAAQLQFVRHSAWMLRAYALGMGAGTQVLTHIPLFVNPAWQGERGRALAMTAGWLINWLLAEWLIASAAQRRGRQVTRVGGGVRMFGGNPGK